MATPVPVRLTAVVAPVDELLVSLSVPLTAPEAVGSNCTLRVALCPDAIVSGNVAPETENPVPETVAALTMTDADPVDDRVNVCVVGVFRFTSPKAMVAASTVSVGVVPTASCNAKAFDTPPALAVTVTV